MPTSPSSCRRAAPLLAWLAGCGGPELACPAEMALAQGRDGPFCIHRYEASFEGFTGHRDQGLAFPDGSTNGLASAQAGRYPRLNMSWYQAFGACARSGMHLCTSAEWEDACDGKPGPGGAEYPTPDGTLQPDQCYVGHPSALLAASGSYPECRTAAGVYDMAGNAWEWTDPGQKGPDGRPLIDKRGGGFYTGAAVPCGKAAVGTHDPTFDGTIGFRCCQAPTPAP